MAAWAGQWHRRGSGAAGKPDAPGNRQGARGGQKATVLSASPGRGEAAPPQLKVGAPMPTNAAPPVVSLSPLARVSGPGEARALSL